MEKICGYCGKKIRDSAEKIGDKWYHNICFYKQLAKNHPLQSKFERRKHK